MSEKTAVLMDGGFVKKKLQQTNHRFPTVPDVVGLYTATMAGPTYGIRPGIDQIVRPK